VPKARYGVGKADGLENFPHPPLRGTFPKGKALNAVEFAVKDYGGENIGAENKLQNSKPEAF